MSSQDDIALTNLFGGLDPAVAETSFEDHLVDATDHETLHRHLAAALTKLRLNVSERFSDDSGFEAIVDVEVLSLFHKLLFIRTFEDRAQADDLPRLETSLERSDVGRACDSVVDAYAAVFNSQLFAPGLARFEDLGDGVGELVESLVEPWTSLKLDFSVSGYDLAGRLYQTYLSMVPAIEDRQQFFPQAVVVDRRRQSGAFYTPASLARTLTRRTLEPWLRANRPARPSDVAILDPACGSGPFLVAAYECLLDWFEEDRDHPLGADERLEILTDSIFGADLDQTALMLAQLQLLEAARLPRRPLPDLTSNLRCGNSLLSRGDPTASGVDWSDVIQSRGGFTSILANPPFANQNTLAEYMDEGARAQLRSLFPKLRSWGQDVAFLFVDLGLSLLADGGTAGFVLPRKVLSGSTAARVLRQFFGSQLREIVDFRGVQLFENAKSYVSCVVFGPSDDVVHTAAIGDSRDPRNRFYQEWTGSSLFERGDYGKDVVERSETWLPFALRWLDRAGELVGRKLVRAQDKPYSLTWVQGTQTGDTRRYTIEEGGPEGWVLKGNSLRRGGAALPVGRAPYFAKGADIRAFAMSPTARRLVLPFDSPLVEGGVNELENVTKLFGPLPANPQPGNLGALLGPKILVRGMGREITSALDAAGEWITIKGTGGGLALANPHLPLSMLQAVTSYLNSSFVQWYLRGMGEPRFDESVEVPLSIAQTLPIPVLEDSEVDALASVFKDALEISDVQDPIDRTVATWALRHRNDDLVLEIVDATDELRTVISREFKRPG